MECEQEEEIPVLVPVSRPVLQQHINKRALRDKSVSIRFNEKDLSDYVGGFHKRKKKRRKEAQRQLQEKERRKRIEARKQRKLEKEFVMYGGALPLSDSLGGGSKPDEDASDLEGDKSKITVPISGTKMYNHGDTTVTVTISELSHEDEDHKVIVPSSKSSSFVTGKSQSLQVKKKPLKRIQIKRSQKHHKRAPQKEKGKKVGKKSRRKR